jgi:anti-sigma factor RsiW
VLTHVRFRRRLGAYLDGALEGRQAKATGAHLAACTRCRREADEFRRLGALLKGSTLTPPPPDWTGFWAGVVRGIEDAGRPAPARRAPYRWQLLWRPRVAFGGALTAAMVAALTFWQAFYAPPTPGAAVIVRSARTELPGGTVMVYAPAEQDMAVVWVFEAE